MVDRSLNEYVRTQLQRGYRPEDIRTTLIQAGYNPQDIDFALRVSSRAIPQRFELTGRNLLLLVGVLLTLIGLIVAGVLVFLPGPKDIQLALRVQPEQLLPGGTLAVFATLTSLQARDVQADLSYVIIEPFTRKVITSRAESLRVGESAFTTQAITLPATIAPGDYEIKLTVAYEGTSRIQSATFTVVPQAPIEGEALQPVITLPPEEELLCPESCDDLNPATEDTCVRGSCVHRFQEGVCGNEACEPGENRVLCPEDCGIVQDKTAVTQQALQVASADPEKAATMCNSLVLPEDSDACFSAIANASMKSALCANIQDSGTRDDCLMDFALAGDYSVCPQLSNRYLLTSCQSLSRFSTLPQEQADAEAQAAQIEAEAAVE